MLQRFAPVTPVDSSATRGGALAVWIALQLLVLLVAVLRIPLSARYPEPAEHLAVPLMLVMQTVAAAALAPMLLASWRDVAAAVVTSWPMLYLSTVLSAMPATTILPAGAGLAGWLIGVALWTQISAAPPWRMAVVSAALALSAGGAILWYLQVEFAHPAAGTDWSVHGGFGPTMGALALLSQGASVPAPWLVIGAILLAGIAARFVSRARAAGA